MTITLTHNDDITPALSGKSDGWESVGDDPNFTLRFGPRRDAHIVLWLQSQNAPVDPKVYVNGGRGFRETHAVGLPLCTAAVVKVDVGQWGTIGSLRFDPASFAAAFTFGFASFASKADADRFAASRCADMPGAHKADLGSINRFWKILPPLGFRRRSRPMIERYAEAHYKLASHAKPIDPAPGEVWLSIVVPVYNAPQRYLDDLRRSVEGQRAGLVQLILSDDGSSNEETLRWLDAAPSGHITVVRNQQNGGIAAATNAGLAVARGTWVGFLDHDDMLAPHALKLIAKALTDNPETQFLYTDELVVNDRLRPTGVMLKPAYDPVLLSGLNYVNHFSVFRRDSLMSLGGLRETFDGSQDYDLVLRYLSEVREDQVRHLPYPAYWWRRTGHTYSRLFMDKATTHARRALAERYGTLTEPAGVLPALTPTLHRVTWDKPASHPKVSIIIPSKDGLELISRVLHHLYEKTDYPNLEVIVVDNGSTDQRVLDLYKRYRAKPNFSAHIKPAAFNFSRAVNEGIALAGGDHILILNNDIEVIAPDWLDEMVGCMRYERTGIVGAKLLYPNGSIQHAGVVAGFLGLAGHWYIGMSGSFGGPMNRLHVRNSMTCVTGAVMLISGDCLRDVGAWDETNFAVAYNDVDFCLRAYKAGWRTVWTPFATLYHHESASRGADITGEKRKRFQREKQLLRDLHQTSGFIDPVLSPSESRDKSYPRLIIPTELPVVRKFYQ